MPEESPTSSTPTPGKASFLKRRAFLLSVVGGTVAGLGGSLLLPRGWLVVSGNGVRDPHAGHDPNAGAKVFYACPMFCTRLDRPGECPVCGMTLEKFVDTGPVLPLDDRDRWAMGIRTQAPARRRLAREIRTLGQFEVDESLDRVVSAWVGGRIDRLYADFTGVAVTEGDHLFDLYSPDLYSAHKELKVAQEGVAAGTPGYDRLLILAREKLRRLGLTASQLAQLEVQPADSATFTVPSPISGVVLEKMAHEGQYLEMGMPVYRVADLSRLWLMLSIHERDLPFIALGQPVQVEVSGLPAVNVAGRVSFIDPALDTMTRTARVRVEVPNEGGRLKPGMFGAATVLAELAADGSLSRPSLDGQYACPMHPLQWSDGAGEFCRICGMALKRRRHQAGKLPAPAWSIPREAVLSTGRRHLVYVEWWAGRNPDGSVAHDHDGRAQRLERPEYQGFEVQLGPLCAEYHEMPGGELHRGGEFYPVLSGLPTGVRIVTNGQFLIDSQQELAGKPSLFRPQGGSSAASHSGH
ncbi:MAG: efflux RND transporter periplasmic adaptor subunit [Planctomycetes bacterium]|nr:efflux RND transporter periplasmic adaptor subunit [Planctomycetota bacterium]